LRVREMTLRVREMILRVREMILRVRKMIFRVAETTPTIAKQGSVKYFVYVAIVYGLAQS